MVFFLFFFWVFFFFFFFAILASFDQLGLTSDPHIKLKKSRDGLNDCKGPVCVEVLRLSQLSGVMSSAVSLPNHTFTGQA